MKDGRLLRDGPTEVVFSDCAGLQAEGIGVGQVREVTERLRRRGVELPLNTVRYEQLLDALAGRESL